MTSSMYGPGDRREVLLRRWEIALLGLGLGATMILLRGHGYPQRAAQPEAIEDRREERCEEATIPSGAASGPALLRREQGRTPPRRCTPTARPRRP